MTCWTSSLVIRRYPRIKQEAAPRFSRSQPLHGTHKQCNIRDYVARCTQQISGCQHDTLRARYLLSCFFSCEENAYTLAVQKIPPDFDDSNQSVSYTYLNNNEQKTQQEFQQLKPSAGKPLKIEKYINWWSPINLQTHALFKSFPRKAFPRMPERR